MEGAPLGDMGDSGLNGAAAAALAIEGGGACFSSASACLAAWGLKKCRMDPASKAQDQSWPCP